MTDHAGRDDADRSSAMGQNGATQDRYKLDGSRARTRAAAGRRARSRRRSGTAHKLVITTKGANGDTVRRGTWKVPTSSASARAERSHEDVLQEGIGRVHSSCSGRRLATLPAFVLYLARRTGQEGQFEVRAQRALEVRGVKCTRRPGALAVGLLSSSRTSPRIPDFSAGPGLSQLSPTTSSLS